ncbi:hypothetical protein TNIN_408491 [Trichonephila inaurata madagascariensis]|uniref:Ferredoxin n=1 Tax=Trichonephila inaurata madagascariensis TaxID=2747483 RepID=A0A8X6YK13_9ARAC|nr:hypothetical protein TNIN_408491 [Trichonephila inaurata madagascariensis]
MSTGIFVMSFCLAKLVGSLIGFCYASNWCRTCHVYFKPEDYDKLPVISSEELYHIKRDPGQVIGSSRLGCQIRLAKNMEGMEVRLPERTGPGWSEE